MKVVALLAAVVALALPGCGDDGAEPGASGEAALVLDFAPNAVHAGLYAAAEHGWFSDEGVELEIREPGESTDAPKLLQAGRAEFAVLDINDWGIAEERGLDLVPIAALVQVPLAAVIAGDRGKVRRPADLQGLTVGVTGLPSDDAVLDRIVASDGGDPAAVERRTIGFDAVAALAAEDPNAALGALLAAVPGLERDVQEAQMAALAEADAFTSGVAAGAIEPSRIANWRRFRAGG